MTLSQETILNSFLSDNLINYDELESKTIAEVYILSAFLKTACDYLKEQLWLIKNETHENHDTVSSFYTTAFQEDLKTLNFLKDILISNKGSYKKTRKKALTMEHNALNYIAKEPRTQRKTFLIKALEEMSQFYNVEERAQEGRLQSLGHNGPRLYRTFDNIDDLFNLNYTKELDIEFDPNEKERLYAGAGVGVQSGYSTILLALENLNLSEGDRIIDLGSGYGRVGLVYSLLRPDLEIIGYEFVSERVDIANEAKNDLNLSDSLAFYAQDLSLDSFELPIAEVYYLYDPFTAETYEYILNQIVEVSKKQKVTIVTKGNAREKLVAVSRKNGWPEPLLIDESNLCIFTSA
ncbi:methyltransferase domain protein [Bacteriovorax sp. DB6_IX]|nr:methyltransferase domain protein [Bacteriovorax sp. DB6_IX]